MRAFVVASLVPSEERVRPASHLDGVHYVVVSLNLPPVMFGERAFRVEGSLLLLADQAVEVPVTP